MIIIIAILSYYYVVKHMAVQILLLWLQLMLVCQLA